MPKLVFEDGEEVPLNDKDVSTIENALINSAEICEQEAERLRKEQQMRRDWRPRVIVTSDPPLKTPDFSNMITAFTESAESYRRTLSKVAGNG